jgi:uncharacterized protein YcfJ
MKKTKQLKNDRIYGAVGKVLCGCAGGIVGFICGGLLLSLPGILAGIFAGHQMEFCLQKRTVRQ